MQRSIYGLKAISEIYQTSAFEKTKKYSKCAFCCKDLVANELEKIEKDYTDRKLKSQNEISEFK